jgi:hypothetical protein
MEQKPSNNVRCYCRVRPDVTSCLKIEADNKSVMLLNGNKENFVFDEVFDKDSKQITIFEIIVKPLLSDAFRGINCTCFTYGQTGAGKTYTLQGTIGSERGVLPRLAEAIFDNNDDNFEVKVSLLEIYKEKLSDLLKEDGISSLRIREQSDGVVWVEGLIEIIVRNETEFNNILQLAIKKRSTGTHSMNKESSRSHFCCIIYFKRFLAGQRIVSKFHLIDLAGSERVRKTDASGSRLQEAKHINKSLSALGKKNYLREFFKQK